MQQKPNSRKSINTPSIPHLQSPKHTQQYNIKARGNTQKLNRFLSQWLQMDGKSVDSQQTVYRQPEQTPDYTHEHAVPPPVSTVYMYCWIPPPPLLARTPDHGFAILYRRVSRSGSITQLADNGKRVRRFGFALHLQPRISLLVPGVKPQRDGEKEHT